MTSIQEKIHTRCDSVMKQMMISGILVSFDKYETSLFHRKKQRKKRETKSFGKRLRTHFSNKNFLGQVHINDRELKYTMFLSHRLQQGVWSFPI